MLSLLELLFLLAVFWGLRWSVRWLKAYVARVQNPPWFFKAPMLLVYLLPFPAAAQSQGVWRFAKPLFWLPVQLLVLIVLYVTYCLARIQYWDHEVRQLCAKDGGLHIYEQIEITQEEAALIRREGKEGFLDIPPKFLYKPGQPVYASDHQRTLIHKGHPSVEKWVYTINRASDDKVLASAVNYGRGGGDPFGPWEPSHSWCPDTYGLAEIQKIFSIK